VTENNQVWLEHLVEVCKGAAARLEGSDDAAHERLMQDIRALQARLQQQLDERGA
jgi:hypothetical protein